jgi:hypothetical protein
MSGGAKPGNQLARTHGGHSEVAVRRASTAQKRAFLKARGLRLADLDAVGVALLDAWARGQAKVVTIDAWFDANGGILDQDGTPKPAAQFYFLAYNSTQRALAKLEAHLAARHPSRTPLEDYLEGYAEETSE